ncbi:MAG: hypothetical protein ACRD2N_15820 [Vicinamibacterales bacterium]
MAITPDNRFAQFDTAISLAALANVLELEGAFDEVAPLLERSLVIRRHLAETDPANVQIKQGLGHVLAFLARVQVKRDESSAARSRAQEAVRVLQALFEVTKDRSAQDGLAYAWTALGLAQRAAGDRGQSCHRRANELYSTVQSVNPDRQIFRDEAGREAAACRGTS